MSVSVRRAQERRMRLPRQRDVIGELSGTGQETVIFLALDAGADERGFHIFPPIARAPAMMLFTMLWYPVQRQRLPSSASRTSFSLGSGWCFAKSSAFITM